MTWWEVWFVQTSHHVALCVEAHFQSTHLDAIQSSTEMGRLLSQRLYVGKLRVEQALDGALDRAGLDKF